MTGRVCARCGEAIAPGRQSTARFCSTRCQTAAWAEAHRGAGRRAAYRRAAEERRDQRRDRIGEALARHRQAAVDRWHDERAGEP